MRLAVPPGHAREPLALAGPVRGERRQHDPFQLGVVRGGADQGAGAGWIFFVTSSSAAVITAPFPPNDTSGSRAGNTVKSTVPVELEEQEVIDGSNRYVSRSAKMVVGLTAIPGVVACVFLLAVLVGQGVDRASLWATVLGLPTGLVAAGAGLWAVVIRPTRLLVPPDVELPQWVVDRPMEAAQVVEALLRRRAGTVGITTALQGAGGFGKTTLARVVCADDRVRRHFTGGVYLLTVGRDVRGGAALAAKVNDVIKFVAGEDAAFTDPGLAGARLGALLDAGSRRLLVLDDVWELGQLSPFIAGGRRCARLVTTRDPGLLGGRGVAVRVDQMSPQQALVLLTSGLPQLDAGLVSELLAMTGRWPLLLRLANKILTNAARAGADVPGASAQLLQRLRAGGPAVVDDLSGEAGRDLDVGQPEERARAVRATIGASTSLLDSRDAQRFAELGVFAEDEKIPFGLIARLWRATGGIDDLEASQVCARLGELALVTVSDNGTGGVALHDVVRDFLRRELGPQRVTQLNSALVNAVAAGLLAADPRDTAPRPARVAWWGIARNDRYLWDHLIEHLLQADRHRDAEDVVCDLRWAGARLEESGLAALAADLSLAGTPTAAGLHEALARAAHLLTPTEPAAAVVDVLHSRLAGDPCWGAQVSALRNAYSRPRLVNRWLPPDLPGSALRRVLTGHAAEVWAVAVAPDGSWLVTASADGTARVWDPTTGKERATLTHHSAVDEVAVAPDGSWLATRSSDGTVTAWDTVTWRTRLTLANKVSAVAIAPDGTWLATARSHHTVQLLDAISGRVRVTLTGYTGQMSAIAVASDGSWLVTGSEEGPAQVWDAMGRRPPVTLVGHNGRINAVATAPNGHWLATASNDRTVKIWGPSGRQARATLAGHTEAVNAVAVAPDGRWLATGSSDRTVRIWDTATWRTRGTLIGHIDAVNAVAIGPEGRWLATGGSDNTARIWDLATEQEAAVPTGRRGAAAEIAVAPDGSWLAAFGASDRTLRIWDPATGRERAALAGQRCAAIASDGSWLATASTSDTVSRVWDTTTWQERVAVTDRHRTGTMLVARDGNWLATDYSDGTVRVWDAATGRQQATLTGRHGGVRLVAAACDGSWLATGDGYGGTIRIWDPTAGGQRAAFTIQGRVNRRAARIVAVAPDSSWLATAGLLTATIRIWNAATWTEQSTLTSLGDQVRILAIAPDSSWLATSATAEGWARIWDVATGQERTALRSWRHGTSVMAVAPDSSWIATTYAGDNTVQIWDTNYGHQRAALTGHDGQVRAVAIAPGARWLATGGDDRTVRIWDAASWRARALMRVEDRILACAWLGAGGLAVGRAGLYLFDFLPGTAAFANNVPI